MLININKNIQIIYIINQILQLNFINLFKISDSSYPTHRLDLYVFFYSMYLIFCI